MDLEHSFTVNAPIDTAWSTMMDIEGVAECFPGAVVTSAEGDSFEGTVKVKLGPIALVYKGSGSFVERDDAAHRAVIEAKGKDKRGNGTAGATVTMSMEQVGSDTRVEVVTDLNVTGKPAQFGRGVMQDVSDKLLGQFVDCLAGRLDGSEQGGAATATSDGGSAAAGASSGATAAGAVPGTTPDDGAGSGSSESPTVAMTAAAPSSDGASAGSASSTPTPAASPASRSSSSGSSDALDLGAAVMPTILRGYAGYAGYAAIALGAFVYGWIKGRGSAKKKRRRSDD